MKTLAGFIILALALSGCGKLNETLEKTKSMPDKMDKMFAETKKMTCELPSKIAFESLLKEDLGRVLDPLPFDLMPFAEEFASCTPNKKLIKILNLWVSKFNEVTLNNPAPTPEDIAKFNHDKLHVLSALQSVAGLIPSEKIEQIVQEQVILNDGPYRPTVMQMLMLRVRFMRDIMLKVKFKKIETIGQMEEAIQHAEAIEYIAKLPFSKEVAVELTGFMDPMPTEIIEVMDPNIARKMWVNIRDKSAAVTVVPKDLTGLPTQDEALFRKRQAQLATGLSLIEERISAWDKALR